MSGLLARGDRVECDALLDVGDHLQFTIDAAMAGLGIALLPSWVGDPLVVENKLVAVLPKHFTTSALHVLTHAGRHLPRRVLLLRDFIVERLSVVCTEAKHGNC